MSTVNVKPVVVNPVVVNPVVVNPVAAPVAMPVMPVESNAELITSTAAQTGLMQVPDDLMDDDKAGLDDLRTIVRPPRVKIVQAQSADLRAEGFQEGDVLLMPSKTKIGNEASPITVTPIFTWTEYLICNPHKVQPFVRERSINPRSDIAMKARARFEELRPEGGQDSKGNPHKISWQESYCFLCWLHGFNVAAVITFMRGEAKTGGAFGSLIQMRGTAVYKGMYTLTVGVHRNNNGDAWKGFNPGNAVPAWVTPAQLEAFKVEHNKFRAAHEAGTLEVDYEETNDDSASGAKVEVNEATKSM